MLQENEERIQVVLEDNKVAGLIRLADLFKEISGVLLLSETRYFGGENGRNSFTGQSWDRTAGM
jgi:hypothetical protein